MQSMHPTMALSVLMIGSKPSFSKTGGLADVLGALPVALARLGPGHAGHPGAGVQFNGPLTIQVRAARRRQNHRAAVADGVRVASPTADLTSGNPSGVGAATTRTTRRWFLARGY